MKWKWKCYGLIRTDNGNGNGIGKWKMLKKDGTMENGKLEGKASLTQ